MIQQELLRLLERNLLQADVLDAAFEARQLFLFVTRQDASACLLHRRDFVSKETEAKALRLLSRRIGGEPLQYLIGEWDFLDETFNVGPGVLIPRPETEELVLLCEKRLKGKSSPVIFDLCAGSGCIGLSLKKRLPDARVTLFECSDPALGFLRSNTERLGLSDQVHILCCDVLNGPPAGSASHADLIVSNPPYIPTAELSALQREVQREPAMALDGGADGLLFYRAFASLWRSALKPGGCFAFECGELQGRLIASLFSAYGDRAEVLQDFNRIDRFVFVSRS